MKKNLLNITLLIFISFMPGTFVLAQIPNNDFELWNNMGLGGENPNDWYTSNGDLVPSNVFKDSINVYSGNYSTLITNIIGIQGSIGSNFPIPNHPFQLKGYFKSDFQTPDSALIKITLFNNSLAVDSGEYFISTSISNWTIIAVTISNTTSIVNSATINITACNHQGNKFWVDLLSLEEPSAILEPQSISDMLFPNPSSDRIYIEGFNTFSSIKIFDLNGRTIKVFSNDSERNNFIRISDIPEGIYFLEGTTEGKVFRKSFVKE